MPMIKEIMKGIADRLPDEATFDGAMYVLYVRQKLDEGLRDLNEGRTYTHEEVKKRILGLRPS